MDTVVNKETLHDTTEQPDFQKINFAESHVVQSSPKEPTMNIEVAPKEVPHTEQAEISSHELPDCNLTPTGDIPSKETDSEQKVACAAVNEYCALDLSASGITSTDTGNGIAEGNNAKNKDPVTVDQSADLINTEIISKDILNTAEDGILGETMDAKNIKADNKDSVVPSVCSDSNGDVEDTTGDNIASSKEILDAKGTEETIHLEAGNVNSDSSVMSNQEAAAVLTEPNLVSQTSLCSTKGDETRRDISAERVKDDPEDVLTSKVDDIQTQVNLSDNLLDCPNDQDDVLLQPKENEKEESEVMDDPLENTKDKILERNETTFEILDDPLENTEDKILKHSETPSEILDDALENTKHLVVKQSITPSEILDDPLENMKDAIVEHSETPSEIVDDPSVNTEDKILKHSEIPPEILHDALENTKDATVGHSETPYGILDDPLENTKDAVVGHSETPFLTYGHQKVSECKHDIEDITSSVATGLLSKESDKPPQRENRDMLVEESTSKEYINAPQVMLKPFERTTSPEQELSDSLFELNARSTGDDRQSTNLPDVIARRPDLIEEVSMSSMSSRDSVEMDAKAETPKATSEVESESGSLKDKKKTPAKRRNDLTQRMEEVPTSQPKERRLEEHLYEYRWPSEGHADFYMLQEQISEYLGVLSFKRKYPDLERRNIDVKERRYLRERGVVTEMQADLGLTAVRADLIHELMARDYPQKYKLYVTVLKERRKQQALERQREIQAQKTDKTRLEQLRKKAIQSASKFNAAFNRERREERKAYFDIHTFEIQYPRKQSQILPPEATKPGAYPVSLIPGQFQDYHKQYTPTELRYLPVNTAMYSSPCKVQNVYADPVAMPSDGEMSTEEAANSEVSTELSELGSDVESMELGSELFEEEEENSVQQEPGKSKEEKKVEISKKVQEILERLKDKEKKSPRRKTSRPGGDESPAAKKKRGDTDSEKPRTPQRRKKGREVTALCNICGGTESQTPSGNKENLVQCSECRRYGHPSCLELTPEMITLIKSYPWQCMECKTCVECKDSQNEDKMLFCDRCDRGYHTFCVGLTTIPNGRWECPSCRPAVVVVPIDIDIPTPNPNLISENACLQRTDNGMTSEINDPPRTEVRPAPPISGVALIAAMPHSKAS